MPGILTDGQKSILTRLPDSLKENFVFAGGTALSEYYLSHRFSDGLDFFALDKGQAVRLFEIKGILKRKGFQIESQRKIFDRCIYSILENDELIKMEFVPLYFPRLKSPVDRQEFGLKIESLEDLTANKIMALAERFEVKDFVDIYYISKQTGWNFQYMIELAQAKESLPYQYTVNVSRIFDHREKLDQVRFTQAIDSYQILSFFKKVDQDLKASLETDFYPEVDDQDDLSPRF